MQNLEVHLWSQNKVAKGRTGQWKFATTEKIVVVEIKSENDVGGFFSLWGIMHQEFA